MNTPATSAGARPGHPDDAVDVWVFLAGDAARYVDGAQILLDGGAMRTL